MSSRSRTAQNWLPYCGDTKVGVSRTYPGAEGDTVLEIADDRRQRTFRLSTRRGELLLEGEAGAEAVVRVHRPGEEALEGRLGRAISLS